jgi:hypothetical protein
MTNKVVKIRSSYDFLNIPDGMMKSASARDHSSKTTRKKENEPAE